MLQILRWLQKEDQSLSILLFDNFSFQINRAGDTFLDIESKINGALYEVPERFLVAHFDNDE